MKTNGKKMQFFMALAVLAVSSNASAATGLDGPAMNILRFVAWLVGALMVLAAAYGAIKGIQGGMLIGKMKESQSDPDLGKKIGINFLQMLVMLGLPAIIVMAVVTTFGSTEVISFIMNGDGGMSTNDMLNLSQGQGTKSE